MPGERPLAQAVPEAELGELQREAPVGPPLAGSVPEAPQLEELGPGEPVGSSPAGSVPGAPQLEERGPEEPVGSSPAGPAPEPPERAELSPGEPSQVAAAGAAKPAAGPAPGYTEPVELPPGERVELSPAPAAGAAKLVAARQCSADRAAYPPADTPPLALAPAGEHQVEAQIRLPCRHRSGTRHPTTAGHRLSQEVSVPKSAHRLRIRR